MIEKIKGMIPPVITPFKEDESIDEEGLRIFVDYLVNHDVYGLFVLGTASEFAYMDIQERIKIVRIIRDQLKSSIPLLMGVADISMKNSLRLLMEGRDIGVDGFVANVPQYFLLDNKQITNYFEEIKKNCNDKPLFAYEVSEIVPTTAQLSPKLVIDLADNKIINGIKYSGVLWNDYAKIVLEGVKDRESIRFFAGSEIITREIVEAGFKFDGGIYSGLNIFPRLYCDTFKAIEAKDEDRIAKLLNLLFSAGGIMGSMSSSGSPIIMKETLKALGLPIAAKVRSPLPSLKKHIYKKIDRLIENLSKEGYADKYE
ncbi:MAG: dihydrodipicolinate synthase family protein [Promethearchaeota archaeon]|nr:MAG: dihydrodipicolinate synthase family protein [Candidatus Lokiarchaeota archaeon]